MAFVTSAPWIPRPTPERRLRYWLKHPEYDAVIAYRVEPDVEVDLANAPWVLTVHRPTWLARQHQAEVFACRGFGEAEAKHALEHAWADLRALGGKWAKRTWIHASYGMIELGLPIDDALMADLRLLAPEPTTEPPDLPVLCARAGHASVRVARTTNGL